jgi:hypothetical protein
MLQTPIIPRKQILPFATPRPTRVWQQGAGSRTEAEILALYFAGWSEAEPRKIADATSAEYSFEDPLVGRFSKHSLPEYFEILRARFAVSGPVVRKDLAFVLRGPIESVGGGRTEQYCREAPSLGLTGVATIAATSKGIFADAVSYDLNMACETLRGK